MLVRDGIKICVRESVWGVVSESQCMGVVGGRECVRVVGRSSV